LSRTTGGPLWQKRRLDEPAIEIREFRTEEEIDSAITKLERRISELQSLNVQEAVLSDNGADDVAKSNVRESIREVFGSNSPEFREHKWLDIWAGSTYMGMSAGEIIEGKKRDNVRKLFRNHGLTAVDYCMAVMA